MNRARDIMTVPEVFEKQNKGELQATLYSYTQKLRRDGSIPQKS